jgi:acyl-CoA synthetase (AMP-forming)/AMP-acid ligase II
MMIGPGSPSLVREIDRRLRLDPEAPALLAEGRWRSYGELVSSIDAVSQALGSLGVGAGSLVAAVLPNTIDGLVALLAVLLRESCIVPLSPRRAREELAAAPPVVATIEPEEASLPGNGFGVAGLAVLAADGAAPTLPGVAVLMSTAGTSGEPKRVPLGYEQIAEGLEGVRRLAGSKRTAGNRSDVNIVCFPLYHLSGLLPLLITFLTGRRTALLPKFDAAAVAGLVREHRITSLALNPTAMRMMIDAAVVPEDLATLRFVRSGSAPLPPDLAAAFEERFGVIVLQSYGQTETGGEIIGWSPADYRVSGAAHRGSVGRPHPGIEVEIVPSGAAPGDEALPVGATGELWARGVPGREGWHRTGDIARIDPEGFVWIEGRADDLIICGGFKVAPLAVERVLAAHPAVADVAVVGVADARLGAVPVAVVVGRNGGVAEDELNAWCRARLESYQAPRAYVWTSSLPRNDAGKVHRPSVATLAAGAQPAV